LASPERLSGTVTFLFTDIEGSTSLLKQLGRARYGELLARQQELLREAFVAYGGEEIDTQGDSFFVAFRSAPDAVAAAVATQRSLADHEWPDGVEVRVRIGIHSGEASAAGERYVGFSVHRAARIGAAAHGGQVLLSDATRVLVEDDLPAGLYLRDLGVFRLKDVDRPERITQVAAEGLRVDFPPLRGAQRVKSQPVLRRRSVLAAALIGVVAAAVAIPVFALSSGGSGSLSAYVRAPVGADAVGVFRTTDGKPVSQAPIGKPPSAVATGAGAVWVASADDNSVSRVDPKTNTVKQTIPVGDGPSGIAVGGGFVWVANSLSTSVSQIDPRANGGSGAVVKVIQIGGRPAGIAFGQGGVWVADASNRSVRRIDSRTSRPGTAFPVDMGADAVAVGAGSVWVASQSAGRVTRLDPASGNEQTVNVGNGPSAITVGGGSVWVANGLDGTVSRIDPQSNSVSSTIPVGAGPNGVAVTPDAGSVWVSNEQAGSLSRIDPVRGVVVQTILTGNQPEGVAVSRDTTYVAVRGSGQAHRGGTLRVLAGPGAGKPPFIVDPINADWQPLLAIDDGLLTYKRAGGVEGTRLVPDLATSVPAPTDHGRTYTFQLRPGIRYSNGAPVRPADFRRTIERILTAPATSTPYSPIYWSGIVGASLCLKTPKRCDLSKGIVTGTNTVSFHLTAPDSDFPYKMALPVAAVVPASTPLVPKQQIPATGPYMIARSNPYGLTEFVRNPYYREWSAAAQPAGYPDRIDFVSFKRSGDAAVRAVEQGKADLVGVRAVSPAVLASLHTGYSSQLHNNPALETDALFLNTTVPPFNSLKARQAFSYAIDRNRLVELRGGRDQSRPTCQILPPALAGYVRYCPYTVAPSPSGKYIGPDLVKARQLVAASGTRGQTVTFVGGRGYMDKDPLTPYFLSVLRQIGYKTRLKLISPKVYTTIYNDPRQRWQVPSWGGWAADWPAPSDFFVPDFTCASFTPTNTNYNFSQFCNPGIDHEIARASALQTTNPQAAAKLWAEVDHDVTDQAPWVTYTNHRGLDFVSHRVGNYIYSAISQGAFIDQLWVR
jgi:YVTN family beta-propeller protein